MSVFPPLTAEERTTIAANDANRAVLTEMTRKIAECDTALAQGTHDYVVLEHKWMREVEKNQLWAKERAEMLQHISRLRVGIDLADGRTTRLLHDLEASHDHEILLRRQMQQQHETSCLFETKLTQMKKDIKRRDRQMEFYQRLLAEKDDLMDTICASIGHSPEQRQTLAMVLSSAKLSLHSSSSLSTRPANSTAVTLPMELATTSNTSCDDDDAPSSPRSGISCSSAPPALCFGHSLSTKSRTQPDGRHGMKSPAINVDAEQTTIR